MKKVVTILLAIIIRGIFLVGGLGFYYMERLANWFIGYYKKTEYIKRGRCKRCGRCCRVLAIQFPRFLKKFPRLMRFLVRWHEFRYGFTYLNDEKNYLLYKCRFLKTDNTCRIYRFRPRLCREYPKMGLFGKPPSHIFCGFYFTRRDGREDFVDLLHKKASE